MKLEKIKAHFPGIVLDRLSSHRPILTPNLLGVLSLSLGKTSFDELDS